MMAKKEYELIASVIMVLPDQTTMQEVAERFANVLALINPRFDRDKFIKACGIEAETEPK